MTNIVIRERDIISSLIDVLSIFSITFSIHLFISSITLLIYLFTSSIIWFLILSLNEKPILKYTLAPKSLSELPFIYELYLISRLSFEIS